MSLKERPRRVGKDESAGRGGLDHSHQQTQESQSNTHRTKYRKAEEQAKEENPKNGLSEYEDVLFWEK